MDKVTGEKPDNKKKFDDRVEEENQSKNESTIFRKVYQKVGWQTWGLIGEFSVQRKEVQFQRKIRKGSVSV